MYMNTCTCITITLSLLCSPQEPRFAGGASTIPRQQILMQPRRDYGLCGGHLSATWRSNTVSHVFDLATRAGITLHVCKLDTRIYLILCIITELVDSVMVQTNYVLQHKRKPGKLYLPQSYASIDSYLAFITECSATNKTPKWLITITKVPKLKSAQVQNCRFISFFFVL